MHNSTIKEEDFLREYIATGSGRIKAVILAAYHLGAKHTLILCPNSIKDAWIKEIRETNFVPDNDFTFEILNYDKFNNTSRADRRIKAILDSHLYDLVVFDEVHRLKKKTSETYNQVFKLSRILRKLNPEMKFIGATSTPDAISDADRQGICELLSGEKQMS